MAFALQHRQAVMVRPQAAGKNGVAVEQQVMGRDRRRDVGAGRAHEVHAFARRDVFEHELQGGEVPQQRRQHALDERGFTVENIDGRIGRLAVHQQRQAARFHARQRGAALGEVGDAGGGIGGRARRVELDGMHAAARPRLVDFVRRGGVGQGQQAEPAGHRGRAQGSRWRRNAGRRQTPRRRSSRS